MPRRKRSGRRLLSVLCVVGLLLVCAAAALHFAGKPWPASTITAASADATARGLPAGVKVYSGRLLLADARSGEIICSKGADQRAYPASLTKIMTVLAALRACQDLDRQITLTEQDFKGLKAQNASVAGFKEGETVTVRDLLYGAMLPSGADAALALANHLFGSEEKMAARMNRMAGELGMTGSHFVNVTGLHHKEHYTTAADMNRLVREAIKDADFRKIFTARRYTVQPTNKHPEGFTVFSSLFQNLPDGDFAGGTLLGGKTGYTSAAGLCLASLAEKEGREYVLVTLGAPGDHTTEQYNIADAVTLYENCPA